MRHQIYKADYCLKHFKLVSRSMILLDTYHRSEKNSADTKRCDFYKLMTPHGPTPPPTQKWSNNFLFRDRRVCFKTGNPAGNGTRTIIHSKAWSSSRTSKILETLVSHHSSRDFYWKKKNVVSELKRDNNIHFSVTKVMTKTYIIRCKGQRG